MAALGGIKSRREERAIADGDSTYDGDSGERKRANVGDAICADTSLGLARTLERSC